MAQRSQVVLVPRIAPETFCPYVIHLQTAYVGASAQHARMVVAFYDLVPQHSPRDKKRVRPQVIVLPSAVFGVGRTQIQILVFRNQHLCLNRLIIIQTGRIAAEFLVESRGAVMCPRAINVVRGSGRENPSRVARMAFVDPGIVNRIAYFGKMVRRHVARFFATIGALDAYLKPRVYCCCWW